MTDIFKKLLADFPQLLIGSPPCRQKFSFPYSLMSHITSNITNQEVYQKLIQTCKYFYSKNPVVIVKVIHIDPKYFWIDGHCVKTKSLKDVPYKFWLKDDALVTCRNSKNSENFNVLISKIYRVNSIDVGFHNVKMMYSDLLLLASKATLSYILIFQCNIVHDFPIDMSDIIKLFMDAKYIALDCSLLITSQTIKKLMEIPAFPNLDQLKLDNVPEELDLEEFVRFMQKHSKIYGSLYFSRNISENHKNAISNAEEMLYKAGIGVVL